MTDRAVLEELLGKVERATGPDRGIDHDLMEAFYDRRTQRTGTSPAYSTYWWADGIGRGDPVEFSASIDAALALVERVLPGWTYTLDSEARLAEVFAPRWPEGASDIGEAQTIPLAILAALLKAKLAETKAEAA